MLRLLIVEDEQLTREGLADLIDWASIGIRIDGLAANGLEAVQLLAAQPADLLLTDIRMPVMDGLQLIEEVRRRDWPTTCILLSGYGDFEYAQKAMRLGVTDYLVKPCSPDDIRSLFVRVAESLREERRRTDRLKGIESRLRASVPHAKSEVLRQWLRHPPVVTEDRRLQLKQLGMSVAFEYPLVIAVRIDHRSLDRYDERTSDVKLVTFAASNIMKETLEQTLMQPIEIVLEQDLLVAVGNGLFEWMEEKVAAGAAKLKDNLQRYLRLSVGIGVSDPKPTLNELHEAFREAAEALEFRFFLGASVVYRRDAERWKAGALPGRLRQAEMLRVEQAAIEHLRAGLFAELLNDTEAWLTAFQGEYTQSREDIHGQTIAFLSRMLQTAAEIAPPGTDVDADPARIREQVHGVDTFEELNGIVYRYIRSVVEALQSRKPMKRKVQQALDYIAERYNESGMSLAGAANALFVSSAYLSSLFKQELGVNFLDYVHQFRIEKAKALLQSTDLKIQAVAREVGYFDEAHFTKTFKKWTGMLPSQYKKETQL
ncbi:response regulator [Paenibacillus sp.]|uniref:response regulator n=1 Tax=Paenibacillus sp. TaxID=58172 RepID=UPI002D6DEC6E|nr:response regulator [Paenibacillus sp.]HZG86880.1 response regulator [Paenibacillus sp.]